MSCCHSFSVALYKDAKKMLSLVSGAKISLYLPFYLKRSKRGRENGDDIKRQRRTCTNMIEYYCCFFLLGTFIRAKKKHILKRKMWKMLFLWWSTASCNQSDFLLSLDTCKTISPFSLYPLQIFMLRKKPRNVASVAIDLRNK